MCKTRLEFLDKNNNSFIVIVTVVIVVLIVRRSITSLISGSEVLLTKTQRGVDELSSPWNQFNQGERHGVKEEHFTLFTLISGVTQQNYY